MMELGCEVRALQSVHINRDNYVEVAFIVDGSEIPESRGMDRFDFPCSIIPGHRFTGTGRQAEYRLENLAGGLGVFDSKEFKKVKIPEGEKIELKLKTNFLLDYNRLPYQVTLLLHFDSQQTEVDLRRPDIAIRWVKRGEFLLDLSPAVKQIYARA